MSAQLSAVSSFRTPRPIPYVPDVDGLDVLGAALAYAAAGLYVLPVRKGTKNPGSVVGSDWPRLSSRDPQVIAAWFAGTDHEIAVHCGPSGVIVVDIDKPDALPDVLYSAIREARPPVQLTRPESEPGRGHCIFAMPAGRRIGNALGKLAGGWGDVRGVNGVIVVGPNADGRRWADVGTIPVLPETVASLLPDAGESAATADDAAVLAFMAEHVAASDPGKLSAVLSVFDRDVAAGAGRHTTAVQLVPWLLREARAGIYPARSGLDALRARFLAAVATTPERDGDPIREFDDLVAWGVGQAGDDDAAARVVSVAERVPDAGKLGAGVGRDGPPMDSGAKLVAPDDGGTPDAPAVVLDVAPGRKVVLKRASDVEMRAVEWTWAERIPRGSLSLIAGREGAGKSTASYTMLAALTRGKLAGDLHGTPRNVVVCATEDSWAHTIVPRLTAAGADLDRVFYVSVVWGTTGTETVLVLPDDIVATEAAVSQVDAAVLLLDPIMSRLDGKLDSHKDQQVRQGLEPLAALADRTGCAVVGLIHLNKGASADALSSVMASRAFTAVARSVLFVQADPDDETEQRRVIGLAKSNLTNRTAVAGLTFELRTETVGADPATGKPITTARLFWTGETDRSVDEVFAASIAPKPTDGPKLEAAKEWLVAFLGARQTRAADRADVERAARTERISAATLKRAAPAVGVVSTREGFPSRSRWTLPVQSAHGTVN